ncbi:MAG: flavodoxin [Candidatus Marinimicrobia bacterium]|nr:flavodoxin [Candidatus Neomarinimicrobiota bacterium]
MKKIGLFWGSTSGNTEIAVEFMEEYLQDEGFEVESFNIADIDVDKMIEFDNIIISCPTWNIGELQDDWDSIFLDYEKLDFSGKIGAFFGCGDQVGYPDNFIDAVGMLAKPFMKNGGKLIGRCSTDDYDFRDSVALDDDKLLGLGLDYDNEEDECEGQMIMWLEDIMEDFI